MSRESLNLILTADLFGYRHKILDSVVEKDYVKIELIV